MTRGAERGMSLAEVLVATTILAFAITIALVTYSTTRRSFKVGDNLTEQQQSVRIAFEQLTRELRLAGLNTNPDGSATRPDEQIEAAFAGAVVLRADLDRDDPVASRDPEDALAGGAFLAVSTGNDELVAYVLGAGSGPDDLVFHADVGDVPRDGNPEEVRIENVSLTHDAPPYTLYRVTVDEDGTPGAPSPMADDIRSLQLVYYDAVGNVIPPPGGDESSASRAARAAIRRIGVRIEGLTRDPDPRWVDPDDPDPATRHLRKFVLEADVTPRNIGLSALRDVGDDRTPPAAPSIAPQIYSGHCGGLLVHWDPNPPADEVAYYRVRFGRSSLGVFEDQRSAATTFVYLGGLLNGESYDVVVEAVDAAGNASAPSPKTVATTANSTTPLAAEAPLAVALPGRIELDWPPVAENAESTTGDPDSPRIRDLSGYRVHRDSDPGFEPSGASLIAFVGAWQTAFNDVTMVNCEPVSYRVVAVDRCGLAGPAGPPTDSASLAAGVPAAPRNVQAYLDGSSSVHLRWDPVTEDENGAPIGLRHYRIYTAGPRPADDPPSLPGDFAGPIEWELTTYDDPVVLGPGETMFYAVTARDECINESVYSEVAGAACSFTGSVEILEPDPRDRVTAAIDVDVRLVGADPVGGYALTLRFVHEPSGVERTEPVAGAHPWSWRWDPSAEPPGRWRIDAEVTQSGGAGGDCTMTTSVAVDVS